MSERDNRTRIDRISDGGALNLSGAVAALVGTALPFGAGIAEGWSFGRVALYACLALPFLAAVVGYLSSRRLAWWFDERLGLFLSFCGLAAAGMLAISGDRYVQPLILTVPYVIAVVNLPPAPVVAVGVLYAGLISAGLWLSGERSPTALFAPAAVYGAVMLFMFAVVRIAIEQTRLAAENARLAAENAAAAALSERNRIARELHDTIAQGLTALTMQLEAAQRAFDRDPERARARLATAHALAREALADVRRSVWALAEQPLDGPALAEALADQTARFSERSGVAASYSHQGPPFDLPGERATQVLRIVQEALQNVEKHACATRVEVRSRRDNGLTLVWVRDDGRGFDPAAPPAPAGAGFGLPSLRERARLAGGSLLVQSAPGEGTVVQVSVPEEPGRDEGEV